MLLNAPASDARKQEQSRDRTTDVIRRYIENLQTLRLSRAETMSCIEAKPGRGDGVTLVICEKERFEDLQKNIADCNENIKKLETAIQRLDEMGGPFLDEIKQRAFNSSNSMLTQQSNISSYSAFYAMRNRGKSPEEILQLPEFVRKRTQAETIISKSQTRLAESEKLIKEIEDVLTSVGC